MIIENPPPEVVIGEKCEARIEMLSEERGPAASAPTGQRFRREQKTRDERTWEKLDELDFVSGIFWIDDDLFSR